MVELLFLSHELLEIYIYYVLHWKSRKWHVPIQLALLSVQCTYKIKAVTRVYSKGVGL